MAPRRRVQDLVQVRHSHDTAANWQALAATGLHDYLPWQIPRWSVVRGRGLHDPLSAVAARGSGVWSPQEGFEVCRSVPVSCR